MVTAFAGNDLFLQAEATEIAPLDAISIDTRGGQSGALAVLVVVDVSGAPMFVPLAVTVLDVYGETTYIGIAPAGSAGLDFKLMAYAQKSVGGTGVIDSSPELVKIR